MDERNELLSYLLEKEGIHPQSPRAIQRITATGPFPLSFSQERFWFLDQFEHAWPVYNSCKVERLIGDLRIDLLEESLNFVIGRHEILRTTYPQHNGQSLQQIAPLGTNTIPLTDLERVPRSQIDHEVQALIRREIQRPFDLASGPVFRANLFRLTENEHLLIITLHQIVFDSRSVAIFFREVWAFYEAKRNGKNPELTELPIQYADFASWQRQRIQGQTLRSHLAYWCEQIGGTLPVLSLPADNPRPPLQSFNGARQWIHLSETLLQKLKELSQANGATLFITLLASFKTLLCRYTGLEDLLVGCPVLNRQLPEVENLIGSFVNTLVLRTSYSGNPTFREALRRVRGVCLNAYEHQELPFERLIEELQPHRDLSRSPLFQVMFAFQNNPVSSLQLSQLSLESIEIDGGIAKFDLTFSLAETEHGLTGYIEYRTDLFNRDTIERMAGHFDTLLEGVVANPDQSISTLPILTEAERQQLVIDWNDTAADYPKDKCIHELFEAQVELTPDAIAVEFNGERITYRDLNRRANQFGRYLIGKGVGVETFVGICLIRSIDMVVGLLGILKAGGAYVPLDPAYPSERLRFILDDACVSVLVTTATLILDSGQIVPQDAAQTSSVDPRCQVVCLDRDLPEIEQESSINPDLRISADNLAYVIYTSGSTGTPKGVAIEHRNAVPLLSWTKTVFTSEDIAGVLASTSICFDLSVFELFMPLSRGGKIVLVENALALRDASIKGITLINTVPSAMAALVAVNALPESVRVVNLAGEPLRAELVDQLYQSTAVKKVYDLYGPSETTTYSTFALRTKEGRATIGRPIANTQIYILDSHLQPVPIGVTGELYIGGAGVARGYLNRPELTKERFIHNPFDDDPNARLYHTGDLAKYLPDGNIQLLGRIDHQVKVRGYRIELGEIEAALVQHPAVKAAVVVVHPRETTGEQELVGYVVTTLSVGELRSFLRAKLPDYMVPSLFVYLDALPLTPNGKIDRSALPPPDGARPVVEQGFVAPRNEIEELTAQVWRDLLKLDKVGVFDNFFELGGHSLLATRVVARLGSNFKVDIGVRKLFGLPTVAALAERIGSLRRDRSGGAVVPITPVVRDQPLPLSFSQRRLWFLQKVDKNLSAYNVPASYRIQGPLDSATLERALNEMIVRHEALRCRIKELSGQPYQEIAPAIQLTLPLVDLTRLTIEQAESEGRRLSVDDASGLYDLEDAPLMRAKLLRLAELDHILILNFHHLVVDGSSLAIFHQELAAIYNALRQGKTPLLKSLPIQFADYAVWQQEWLKSPAYENQLAYWKRQLAELPPPTLVPNDFQRPATPSYRGARIARALSAELTGTLESLSRRHGVTLFMTLFATFAILLSRISGQKDIVVGSTIAGRNRPEIDGVVGFFINAIPLRVALSGHGSFLSLLDHVREVCLDGYTHQDVPLEKIVEEIKPQRELSHNPLFDILFNVADSSERMLSLSGCEAVKLGYAEPAAKFDIVLSAPKIDGAIEIAVVYKSELFRAARIAILLEQFESLLAQIAGNPEQTVDRLSLATPGSHSVLVDPGERLDGVCKSTAHELLATQTSAAPDRAAIVDAAETWTYREVDRCSNRLANYLLATGIQPKDVVAIYAHRSAPLVVAMFGILKASAAFTIVDPAYPAQRLIDYLCIAQPTGWLQLDGVGELPQELADYIGGLALRCRMDVPGRKTELFEALGQFADACPNVSVTAKDPAYVAFTSGSTGEPKGVLCRQGPITHFLPWQKAAFELRQEDRFAMLSGLAYSHLHRDVFTALCMGATLYIPESNVARSPDRLARWLDFNAITVLHLTPALGQLLLTGDHKPLAAVRRVFFGGDALTFGEVARFRALAPNAKIGSFYGATETQRAVGYYEIPEDSPGVRSDSAKAVPLGRGIQDVQLLVLNDNLQLAAIGELGEIFVRSPHLAQGYLGDAKRTAEMFIVNPFTNDPDDRLYRTGELGRYLADGNIEWTGRNDRRVNIRGYRVELEEIETLLKQHPAVNDAAVVLRDYEIPAPENSKLETRNPKQDQRLIAYIVSGDKQQSLADLLRGYLNTRLPDYMVPAYYVNLASLPLNPNGKVDYRALPALSLSTDAAAAGPPRNPIEEKLCAIFAELLGCPSVGIGENFFRIGGHSLLAARAAARIGDAFGVTLGLLTFLEKPTVIDLAKELKSLLAAGQTSPQSDKDGREEFDL